MTNSSYLNSDKFFSRNRLLFVILLSFLIALSIAFTAYKINKKTNQEKFSELLHQSMIDQQIGDIEKTKKSLNIIHNSNKAPSGVWSLASLRYAGILLEEGNKEESIKIYKKINSCKFCDSYIKDLGGLLFAKTIMTDNNLTQDKNIINDILKIENNAKVLKYFIAEQRAYLEINNNNLNKAYEIFEMISKSPEVKEGLKSRSIDAMKIIIQKGYKPK